MPSSGLVLFALLVIGCGGSGSSGIPGTTNGGATNGGSTNGGNISQQQRETAMAAVEAAVDQAMDQPEDTAEQTILAAVQGNPAFEASGLNEDGSVWGRFRDGRLMVVGAERPLEGDDSDDGLRPSAARVSVIPNGRKAFVMDAYGADLSGRDGNAMMEAQAYLALGGYDVVTDGQSMNMTVDYLKTVKDAAVFFATAHGGVGFTRANEPVVIITTATRVTPENEQKYEADLKDGSLTYFLAYSRGGGKFGRYKMRRFSMTHHFVRKYMTFAPDALAVIDACSSYRYDDFGDAFDMKGATYIGWDQKIGAYDGERTMKYLFNRLLGMDDVPEKEPGGPQRPFNWAELKDAMAEKNPRLDEHLRGSKGPGMVKLRINADRTPGMLAPSIERVATEEAQNELIVTGSFPMEEGTVQISGQNLTIKSWDAQQIVCDLPVTGPASSGDVQVFWRGRKSNIVTLTEWNGTMKYTYEDVGSLKETMETKIRFRADARNFRIQAGKPLEQAVSTFNLTSDCIGSYQASGTHSDGIAQTDWEGNATLRAPQVDGGEGVWFNGALYNGEFWWFVWFAKGDAKKITFTTKFDGTTITRDGATGIKGDVFGGDGKMDMQIQSDLVFPGGRATAKYPSELGGDAEATATLEWSSFVPKNPPRAETPR